MTKDEALSKSREIVECLFCEIDSPIRCECCEHNVKRVAQALCERPQVSEVMRHCKKCRSQRKHGTCHKCGSETFIPDSRWENPKLPPVEKIRELAKEVGYAIGVHGSQERDLDLIAAPWTEKATGNYGLIEHIAKGLGAKIIDIDRKPFGRYAGTIQMDGYFKAIDLSVCPQLSTPAEHVTDEEIRDLAHTACVDPEDAAAWEKGYRAAKAESQIKKGRGAPVGDASCDRFDSDALHQSISDEEIEKLAREFSTACGGFVGPAYAYSAGYRAAMERNAVAEILKRFPSVAQFAEWWGGYLIAYKKLPSPSEVYNWLREKLTRAEHREAGGE